MEISPELAQKIEALKEAAKTIPHSHRFIDLSGQKFNRLQVICFAGRGYHNSSKFWCLCDCGKLTEVLGTNITRGATTSCGCALSEITRKRSTKHGLASRAGRSKEYYAWAHAKQRVSNPNCHRWKWYGGRGIKMCKGARDFEVFISVIGPAPEKSLSLDRKDTNGHYSCGQCEECHANGWPMNMRWVTWVEQMNNTRRNHFVSYKGKAYTIAQLSKELGLDPIKLRYHLVNRWDMESAIIRSRL